MSRSRLLIRQGYAGSARKRALDVVVASTVLVVCSPLVALTAVTARLTGRRSVVKRVSYVSVGGSVMQLPFFDLPRGIGADASPRAGSIGARAGRTLRAARAHELPLLWSVIRGRLSMVGPAPRRALATRSADPVELVILETRPGLTGLTQLQRRGVRATSDRKQGRGASLGARRSLDAYYVTHQSLALDARILLRAAASLGRRALARLAKVLTPPVPREMRARSRRAVAGVPERLARLRGRELFMVDLLGLAVAIYLAFALRFDDVTIAWLLEGPYLPAAVMVFAIRPSTQLAIGLYWSAWRHASVPEMVNIINAVFAGSLLAVAAFYLGMPLLGGAPSDGFPRSFWVLEALLTLTFVAGSRLLIRGATSRQHDEPFVRAPRRQRTLLYGAGRVGAMVARSAAREHAAGVDPVGFLDDDRRRRAQRVAGLRVYGDLQALPDAIALTGAEVLLITMPSAPGTVIRRITEAGMAAGLQVRTVPALHELFDGSVDAFRIRHVRVEDLIRRPEVSVLGSEVESLIQDRTVIVTGAGGSIGSELARQVFAMGPRRMVLVDRAESALYAIERELEAREGPAGTVEIQLSNVASRELMRRVVSESRPDVIFHAAAYKHVPLMEAHPSEARAHQHRAARWRCSTPRPPRASERFVLDLDRQGGEPDQRHGRHQARGRDVLRRRRPRDAPADALHGGALRQRARLDGQRHPDVPGADGARRAAHRHAPGDDPLLHDHPGGRALVLQAAAHRRRRATSSCWTWASR